MARSSTSVPKTFTSWLLNEGPRTSARDGEGESLFPRRATCAPDPDRLAGTPVGEHLGNDLGGERVPAFRVPEERRRLDEHGGEERVVLGGMLVEELRVVGDALQPAILHPPLDPPVQRRALVAAEIEVPRFSQLL